MNLFGTLVKWSVFLSYFPLPQAKSAPFWQQYWFCTPEETILNQTLTIRNLNKDASQKCTFTPSVFPCYFNCSKLESKVFIANESCLEMVASDNASQKFNLEYGRGRNGKHLPPVLGGLLSEEQVGAKIQQYTTSGQENRSLSVNTHSSKSTPTSPKSSNKLDRHLHFTLRFAAFAVAVSLVLFLAFASYYISRKKCLQNQPSNDYELQQVQSVEEETTSQLLANGTSGADPEKKHAG
ncbi:uncharacterized protein [Hyperolius riggenbachi]|uniref:uncharacterized protein isoform X2 n=1 Tax=Hyperolius riggenbachi TaxID=752182 RepID=UPI0035A39AA4